MSEEIRVDPAYLADLAARYRSIAGSLRDVKRTGAEFRNAPPVQAAFSSFQSRWDWRRDKLAEAADDFAGAITTMSKAFTDIDRAIAASLHSSNGQAGTAR
jgi:uncharacterized protein YukE